MTGALLVIACIGALLAARLRRSVARLERDMGRLRGAARDAATSTYGESAIPVTLAPELEYAVSSNIPAVLAVFRVHSADTTPALARIGRTARRHEAVFRVGERDVAILLWGVDEDRAVRAVARLGMSLLGPECRVADAGIARVPSDATSVDAALAHARARLRDVRDYAAYSSTESLAA